MARALANLRVRPRVRSIYLAQIRPKGKSKSRRTFWSRQKRPQYTPLARPGGPIHALARAYGEKLAKHWGQTDIIDPKPAAPATL